MQTQYSTRISRLLKQAKDDFSQNELHMLVKESDMAAFADLAFRTYSQNTDKPEILRKLQFLAAFADQYPISINPDELIVGSQAFGLRRAWVGKLTQDQQEAMQFFGNNGHVIVDYGHVLTVGLAGLADAVDEMPIDTEEQSRNQQAFRQVIQAFSRFIERHAQAAMDQARNCSDADIKEALMQVSANCSWISQQAPRTFWEALQLTWFIQLFLHAEGGASAVSFGRFDQYLGSFMERDLADGLIDMALADELLSCFWLKACEGDESQNLIVGGTDANGNNAENLLSTLCLRVAAKLQVWQPSTSVRILPDSSDDLWAAALELVKSGTGQPSFFNDPVVTQSMRVLDIPDVDARNWGIVGCYEATPQGNTYGCTVNGSMPLPQIFLGFLAEAEQSDSFDTFYQAFCQCLETYYHETCLNDCRNFQTHARTCQISPFESVCLTGCLQSGLTAEEQGAQLNLLGINCLGIGTVIDSLYVIRKLVFEQGVISLSELKRQLRDDFPDQSLLCQCRELSGKYGSDSAETNQLAADLSDRLTHMIVESRLPHGVRPYPALFKFSADIFASVAATPDGRKADDKLSYGTGPGIYCKESNVTSIMNSVTHIAHHRCGCGSPLIISLNGNDLKDQEGKQKVRQLIETFFSKGAFQIQFNVVDAETLRQAQKQPEHYRELTVRISGYSARFCSIRPRWQDAIIERTERNM